jgi:hypothetical protein
LLSAVGAIVLWGSTGAAGAAITNFTMSPTSGPPGTVVHVSGTGCAPGLLAALNTDFVTVSAATLGVTLRAPLASNGSWQGTFTVPSGGPGASVAPVAAVCVSSGIQSLLTIYTPQQFTVTAASPPTTTAPGATQSPTTKPTVPKGGSSGPVPGTTPRTHPDGSGPASRPSTTLGSGISAALPGFGFGPVGRDPASGRRSASATKGTRGHASATTKRALAVEAATLQPAYLGGALTADHDSGGLGWLGWLLLLALVLGGAGAAAWMWWSRRDGRTPAEDAV